MCSKIRQQWSMLAVLLFLCLTLLNACWQGTLPVSTPQSGTPSASLPEFLSYVEPRPGAEVAKGVLSSKGVWAILRLEEITEPDETLDLEEMQKRVEFLMDGRVLDAEIAWGRKPGAAEVEVLGDFDVPPGEHRATVRASRTSGEVLEYSWTFTILGTETSLLGLPKEFQFVRPLPDSIITQQAYRNEQLISPHQVPAFADLRGGVCVGVFTVEIVELGKNLDGDGVSDKYAFVALDGVPPNASAKIEEGYEAGEFVIEDENGVIASGPGPHHYKCWKVNLGPGEHKVTVQLMNASGETVGYTWQFTIMDD